MNRTIEQWQEVADAGCKFHSVLNEAISDLQELARQRDELQMMLDTERAAWSAKRMDLLRRNDEELNRRKDVERQRDALLVALEYCIKQVPEFSDVPGIASAIQQVRSKE